jgi:hypothetical protein
MKKLEAITDVFSYALAIGLANIGIPPNYSRI